MQEIKIDGSDMTATTMTAASLHSPTLSETSGESMTSGGGGGGGRRSTTMGMTNGRGRRGLLASKCQNEDELQELRLKINSRERSRMHDLNRAMDELRETLPYAQGPSVRKLSKISTLLLARNYILMLNNSLNEMKKLIADIYPNNQLTATGQQLRTALNPFPAVSMPTLPPSAGNSCVTSGEVSLAGTIPWNAIGMGTPPVATPPPVKQQQPPSSGKSPEESGGGERRRATSRAARTQGEDDDGQKPKQSSPLAVENLVSTAPKSTDTSDEPASKRVRHSDNGKTHGGKQHETTAATARPQGNVLSFAAAAAMSNWSGRPSHFGAVPACSSCTDALNSGSGGGDDQRQTCRLRQVAAQQSMEAIAAAQHTYHLASPGIINPFMDFANFHFSR